MSPTHDAVPEVDRARSLVSLLERRGDEVLRIWVSLQSQGSATLGAVGDSAELTARSQELLAALKEGVSRTERVDDPAGPGFEPLRAVVVDISRTGVRTGASPAEIAHGVLAPGPDAVDDLGG